MINRRFRYLWLALIPALLAGWMLFDSEEDELSEKVKVSLREVGNQLLLSNGDSTSLILPILELERSKFQLSFEDSLSFDPGILANTIRDKFNEKRLPKDYRIKVVQCEDEEVAHSYEVFEKNTKDIIACRGRPLPLGCYRIEVKFIKLQSSSFVLPMLLLGLSLVLLLLFILGKKEKVEIEQEPTAFASIGSFQFYPEQNKLVKSALEINLSNKECELLAIFAANPNQVVKREELTKKVWEDNGVFVGRSLDTYVSKLRKKLKEDASIKITNVHGIGYKLEINR